MRRREFITLVSGTALSVPLTALAQQSSRVRRIGVLMSTNAEDPLGQAAITALVQGLQQKGWEISTNVLIDYRWGASDVERIRRYATELVALAPDVILAATSLSVVALQQATHTLPIVFVQVSDPVGAGFVASLAQPGGNTTGFMVYEYTIGPKWLELLKEIAPRVTRVGLLRDASSVAEIGLFGAVRAAAPAMGMDSSPLTVRDADEIERDIAAFAREPNGGLIVLGAVASVVHREQIITLAARYRLPAVYPDHIFVTAGGLISYGPDRVDQYRRAAGYVDRILKGEKPADLPVQAPVKYELAVNLKTAKATGLTVPQSILSRADEVIE